MKKWGKTKKVIVISLIVCLCLGVVGAATIFGTNARVKNYGKERLLTSEEAAKLTDVDCIIVLGCQVHDDGTPSWMLADRVKRGVELYKLGVAPKLLMSGDHGQQNYNEVATMKQLAIDDGVESSDVFMDHAGFSTYESMYRARDVFQAKKVVIVSQEYHLYRAIYTAEKLGLEAYGVHADLNVYGGRRVRTMREVREILARFKDCMTTMFKVKPTYLGEAIPVSGDGDVTND